MASSKKRRWSYSAGERGRNRVRAYEDNTSDVLMLEYTRDGQRKRVSLRPRDRERAKRQVDEAAAKLAVAKPVAERVVTLGELFDIYGSEVTPRKSPRIRQQDRSTAALLGRHLGTRRKIPTLNRRDWDGYIEARKSGRLKAVGSRRPGGVGPRTVDKELRFLSAVLNWATVAGDGRGAFLDRNPLKGLPFPKEPSPNRPMVSQERYEAMLAVAHRVDWRFEVALILAHETGHRIGAVRTLRWSDVDLESGLVTWRKQNDKQGFEHVTPVSSGAVRAFKIARKYNPGVGEAWVFPGPRKASEGLRREALRSWWKKAERLAGLDAIPGLGWHGLRRKFATDLKDTPLKDLCHLGGWKTHTTVLECYQRPEEGRMREALEQRARSANRQ